MDSEFFSVAGKDDYVMQINGLTCFLNMPRALTKHKGRNGVEQAQGLPPYAIRQVFLVDQYPASPAEWPRSSMAGIPQTSYFVPVLPDHGMWLDFNQNNFENPYYVAVVISIQGINPITGEKTAGIHMEQYREKCPVHDIKFGPERFCQECGYKWDAQNYLASNATPSHLLWLDGFRAKDGVVRQYIFTTETMRGVAAQLIGNERVFAIGIGFFLSKDPKPVQKAKDVRFRSSGHFDPHDVLESQIELPRLFHDYRKDLITMSLPSEKPVRYVRRMMIGDPVEKLEIGAGARINQRIYPDPEDLKFWREEPAGVIYINYVKEADAQAIISAGCLDLTAGGEGFLQGLKTGNPA